MLKKSLLVGAGVALLATLLVGPGNICSYAATAIAKARGTFKDSVPVQFELDRAREMVKGLEPEIRRHTLEIARVEVDVEKLERDVVSREESLARHEREMMQLKEDLDQGGSVFVYAKRHYTADEVRADLTARFTQFKTEEATLANMRKILNARRTGLEAARQKLAEMGNAKAQLKAEIAELESQLKILEVAQTRSEYNFDDSRLARTKELINDIRTRIEVESKLANADTDSVERIPVGVEAEEEVDISQAISEYFADQPAEADYVGADR